MNTSTRRSPSLDPTFLLRSAMERIRLLEAEVLRLQPKPTQGEKCITVFQTGRLIRVPITTIQYFKSESNYTRIFLTNGEQFFVSRTLKSWVDEIGDTGFLRCHRSYLVNEHVIKEINRASGNLCLTDGTSVPTARRFRQASVKTIFGIGGKLSHHSTAKPDCTVHKLMHQSGLATS